MSLHMLPLKRWLSGWHISAQALRQRGMMPDIQDLHLFASLSLLPG
jgi:hypothetical protein